MTGLVIETLDKLEEKKIHSHKGLRVYGWLPVLQVITDSGLINKRTRPLLDNLSYISLMALIARNLILTTRSVGCLKIFLY